LSGITEELKAYGDPSRVHQKSSHRIEDQVEKKDGHIERRKKMFLFIETIQIEAHGAKMPTARFVRYFTDRKLLKYIHTQ
jgi:hypothetical protein